MILLCTLVVPFFLFSFTFYNLKGGICWLKCLFFWFSFPFVPSLDFGGQSADLISSYFIKRIAA